MRPGKLLLCTDMDRTVIPNGCEPEHPAARPCLRQFCRRPEVCLVYVTGRHRALVEEAIASYQLPTPEYVIADVGTRIYRLVAGDWQELAEWQKVIGADWQGIDHGQLRQALAPRAELRLQEQGKQNTFKLSYYLPLDVDLDPLLGWIDTRLQALGVAASLIWSIDETENIGLLDVLPRHATKLHGIAFLQQRLGYADKEVVFAGDSGNDLPVLISPIPSVLVANASAELKQQAQRLARDQGHAEALYLAGAEGFPLGGNYAAGVLQGVWHFAPRMRPHLPQIGPES